VDYDYANYSAHLFLSDSYNALRDPTDFNLRYDTPWLNELLLANLLAPPGAGTLSRSVTQHEYSKLFEGDRFGLSTDSEYNSDGQFKEIVSQFGSRGNTSYSLDLDYRHYDGVRVNNDLDRIEWFSQIKQQLTPKDSVLLFTEYRDFNSGDNFEYYNPTNARPNYRATESQKPNVLVGFRHEWTPDIQTLLLGGWLQDHQSFNDNNVSLNTAVTNNGAVVGGANLPFDVSTMTRFEVWTLELNQIVQDDHQRLIAGGKFQSGDFHTIDTLNFPSNFGSLSNLFSSPPATSDTHNDFQRFSAYAYYTRELLPDLSLTAGLSFEHMTYPTDFRIPPTFGGTTTREQLNPKGAVVWTPLKQVTLRGIYARGLGGVSYDQNYRLEPTELAGFVQSFGSTIPESVDGALSAPDCQVYGGAVDVKLASRTYFGVQVQQLTVSEDEQVGEFFFSGIPPVTPGGTQRTLNYRETSVAASLNQLLSDEWALGISYRYTDASLKTAFPFIATFSSTVDTSQSAALHQANMFILYNHPSGFFARLDNNWYHQNDWGYTPALASTDFWQQNLTIGYRLKRQRGEISFSILNLGDQDYQLNPLTLYNELPRDRTYVGRIKFNF
jgi:hypothetical protein